MKKLFKILFLLMLSVCRLHAQSREAEQLLLNAQKLTQFKQILNDMKKGYQTLNSGYNTIKDLSQGNFNLHQTFLDGLMQVSPEVRNYKRVTDIISYQLLLVKEYKTAFKRFKSSGNLNPKELEYLGRVYNNLFKQSLNNLDELTTVVTENKLRMSDDERLKEIDRIYEDMQDKLQFLRHLNNQTAVLALQRYKEKNDVQSLQSSYGIKP